LQNLFPEEEFSIQETGLSVSYTPEFITSLDATAILERLKREIQWSQPELLLYGRRVKTPRLVAWYGDPEATYRYSGLLNIPVPFTEQLESLKRRVEQKTETHFNSVLLNWYRTGTDSMAWHSDDEKELGLRPTIASLTLGGTRTFSLRQKALHAHKREMKLGHGSLLVMSGDTQATHEHQVKKEPKVTAERINLTFRWVFKTKT
jgi:alkylated DNA repair dioxygenase AlkB